MVDVLFQIDIMKINQKYDIDDIYAGVICDKHGNKYKKILFQKDNNYAENVFNNERYSLNQEDEVYIDNIMSMRKLLINFFDVHTLNMKQMLMAYKMFLNDEKFINDHLEYFGMLKRSVGYKGKEEIVRDPYTFNTSGQDLYYQLLSIIKFDVQKKDNEKKK